MILIGLEQCPGCEIVKEKYPNLPYKELPRKVKDGDTQSMNLKKSRLTILYWICIDLLNFNYVQSSLSIDVIKKKEESIRVICFHHQYLKMVILLI